MTIRNDVKWISEEEAEARESTDSQAPDLDATGRQPAGRVIHDARGNAVWKWAGDTSSTGTSSGILKYIDPRDLDVEGQGGGSPEARGSRTRVTDSGGGYDPYNQGELKNRTAAPNKSRGKR